MTFYLIVLTFALILPNYIRELWSSSLKSISYKNSYLNDLADKYTKELLGKLLAPKTKMGTVHKQDLVITKHYLDNLSHQI